MIFFEGSEYVGVFETCNPRDRKSLKLQIELQCRVDPNGRRSETKVTQKFSSQIQPLCSAAKNAPRNHEVDSYSKDISDVPDKIGRAHV